MRLTSRSASGLTNFGVSRPSLVVPTKIGKSSANPSERKARLYDFTGSRRERRRSSAGKIVVQPDASVKSAVSRNAITDVSTGYGKLHFHSYERPWHQLSGSVSPQTAF